MINTGKQRPMKKILIYIVLIAAVSACSEGNKDAESIKKEINKHKTEITKIEGKIKELEKQLEADSSANGADYMVLVETQLIRQDTFEHFVEITGYIEPEFQSYISPEINGQITKIHVQEGERVSKGQLMVQLKTDVTEKSIAELEKSLELSETMYRKQKSLWDQGIGSEIQYLQSKNNMESMEKRLETLAAQLEMASIRAPYNGIVDEVYQKRGEIASPGRQVLQLVDLDHLKVNADISEYYIPYIAKGNMVVVRFPTYPDILVEAPIHRISNVINPNNRTVIVQVNIPNEQKLLKPNMISKVTIKDFVNNSAFIVPSIVVKKDSEGQEFIYILSEKDGKVVSSRRNIESGKSYGPHTEIVKGLKEGEKVVVKGYNLVKNGTLVREN